MKIQKWLEEHLEKPFYEVEIRRAEMWCSRQRKPKNIRHKKVLAYKG